MRAGVAVARAASALTTDREGTSMPMATRIIPVGTVFGKWTVVSGACNPLSRHRIDVRCVCGRQYTVAARELLRGNSGGCAFCSNRKHGQSHDNKSRTYASWLKMRERCYRVNEPLYRRYYQDRGITVCERWSGRDGFMNFLADLGERPPGTSLDRVNNAGNYEPGNCRWATPREQATNRRKPQRRNVIPPTQDDVLNGS
jgi:hypothetical protein